METRTIINLDNFQFVQDIPLKSKNKAILQFYV